MKRRQRKIVRLSKKVINSVDSTWRGFDPQFVTFESDRGSKGFIEEYNPDPQYILSLFPDVSSNKSKGGNK